MDVTRASLPGAALDPIELALVEVDAAIALVARGLAVTVTVSGMPVAEQLAATAAARAQAEGLAFHVLREAPVSVTLVIGPRAAAALLDSGT